MKRNILAVVLGYALWTLLWLAGNALLFSEAAEVIAAGERYEEVGSLVSVIVLALICSFAAGWCAAHLATSHGAAVTVMAVLLLATGVLVQWGVWNLMPLWYHIIFLGSILPLARVGQRVKTRGAS